MSPKSSVLDILPFMAKKSPKKLPKHIAITAEGTLVWMKKNRAGENEAYLKREKVITDLIQFQVKAAIPIMTVYVLDDNKHPAEELESLQKFLKNIGTSKILHSSQVKVSVLGKWYDLPGYLVEQIKTLIDETKDYDRFFLNLCLNYNGQEEIVDSCRLIARKIKAGKIDIESINSELIKENLYCSYFLPPDLIIKTGTRKSWSNLLLWDSVDAHYFFAGRLFNDMTTDDLERAIDDFNRSS